MTGENLAFLVFYPKRPFLVGLLDIDAVATQLDKDSGEVLAAGVQMQQLRNVVSQQQAVITVMQQGHLHLRLLRWGHLFFLFHFRMANLQKLVKCRGHLLEEVTCQDPLWIHQLATNPFNMGTAGPSGSTWNSL